MDAERYQQLKNSVQELRSQVRVKATSPVPVAVDSGAPKSSASLQLLQLQFSILEQARQNEVAKLQNRFNEKLKQIDALKAKCAKKIKKSEDNYYFLKEHFRNMERDVYERVTTAEQEFMCQQAKLRSEYKELEVQLVQREHDLVASYESTISALERKNNEKNLSKKLLDEQLERVIGENSDLRERIMLLELESRAAKEEFRRLYREQEKDWNAKIQNVTETQEAELESLKSALERDRLQSDAEKLQLNTEFQEYKAQKVKEINLLEQHIRVAFESKDAKIMQLKRELQRLQQQLDQTSNLLG